MVNENLKSLYIYNFFNKKLENPVKKKYMYNILYNFYYIIKVNLHLSLNLNYNSDSE